MKWTVGTKIGAGFALALIAVVVIGVVSYRGTNEILKSTDARKHTHAVLLGIKDFVSLMKDAETGQRGYIITGDAKYLEPYQAAVSAVHQKLVDLTNLTKENETHRARFRAIEPLVESKLAELAETIDLRKDEAKGFEAALQVIRTDKGKKVMDDIRKLLGEVDSEESELYIKQSETAHASAENTTYSIVFSTVSSFVLLSLAGFFITQSIAKPLGDITAAAERIAVGDLDVAIEASHRGDEIGLLARAFSQMTQSLQTMAKGAEEVAAGNLTVLIKPQSAKDVVGNALSVMVEKLSALIGQVRKSGIQVTTSGTEIAATAKQQQATANEISATTTEISATAKEISATSKELVKAMKDVTEVAEETATLANSGQAGLTRMDATMRQIMEASGSINARLAVLNEKAGNINTVVTTIAKVADQPNLLSLNAAIEAEKAGEYGRGFAVVATEIRRLADQTAAATSDIEQMVKEMQSAVSAGVMGMDKFSEEVRRGGEVVREVSAQLTKIIEQVQTLTPSFETVNEGMQSQSVGAQQISEALAQLGEAAQQTVESLRQSNAAIEQLNEVTAGLQSGVSRFKLEV
jgi:methyl-accepting chemotaxis protein WspA